jgi:hypothetical protein
MAASTCIKELIMPPKGEHVDEDELLNKIKQDIPKTGFVTEMLVTAVFKVAGWGAVDHAYYMDRDENKGREIDIVAVRMIEKESETRKIALTLALSIEVKKVASKPWVVFTSPRLDNENIHDLFATSLIRLNIQEIWFHELYGNHRITNSGVLGRVAYQAFQNKKPPTGDSSKDEGYSLQTFGALVSCFKASDQLTALIRQGEQAPLRDTTNRKTYGIGIVHGLIVLDGKLFTAHVHSRTRIDVEEAHHVPYIFNYASKEYGHRRMLIDIVTIDGLPNYVREYDKWLDERAEFCLSQLS